MDVNNLKIYTMLLAYSVCVSSQILSIENSYNKNTNLDSDYNEIFKLKTNSINNDHGLAKRSISNNTDHINDIGHISIDKVSDDSFLNDTSQNFDTANKSDKMAYGNVATKEDYSSNDITTEEPCVGDVEFCNMTKEEYIKMMNDYIFPRPYEWALIAVHGIVFIIGLIGNALVCIAVYRNHSMRTATNFFIVNLAVADFMVILICLPLTVLWDVTETWFFGTAMCKIVLYFQLVSATVSVLTLTFISVDRWYAICFPLKFKSTKGRAKNGILIIWCLSLLFNIPEFVVLQVLHKTELRFNVEYFMQCTSTWSAQNDRMWHIIKAIFLYTLPLFLMMIMYCQIVRILWRSDNIPGHIESHKLCTSPGQNNWLAANRRTTPCIHANASTEGQLRSRRKAAKMLIAVVIMFAVCYFPVHLLCVLRIALDIEQTDMMTFIALLSHVMCYANSAVNPLIYNYMSGKFRREFHRFYFKCFGCCLTPSPAQNGTSLAPIGSSRAGTTRTIVRRNDSCVSYRLNHLSSSNHKNIHRDLVVNSNTSFIEQINGNRRPKIRDDYIRESTIFTLATDANRDCQLRKDKLYMCYNADVTGDGMESYIARSTNSIDCKPYYNCFKGEGSSFKLVKSQAVELGNAVDERYSDTYADYRKTDEKDAFSVNCQTRNGFKFKFNRSLNGVHRSLILNPID